MLVSTILLTSVSKFENSQKDLGFRWGLAFNFLMMKIDVCIISGSFIVNPKLVLNQNFHAIFVKGNCHWIHIHITFPFLTIRSLLFFFFKWGGVNFITSTRGWRLKNKGGSMVQKQIQSWFLIKIFMPFSWKVIVIESISTLHFLFLQFDPSCFSFLNGVE